MSRFGLAVRPQAGKQKDLGSIPLRLAFLFRNCDLWSLVSLFGLAVRPQAGKQKDLGSIPLRLAFLFRNCDLWSLVTLHLTINETLKWLSSLPILMQESF